MSAPKLRTGMGFDVHRLVPDRPMILGGVVLDSPLGLEGHSDADALAHAAADALLGAASLGDLGEHFPDTDPTWRDAYSIDLLGQVANLVRTAGWQVANVDCTMVLEAPKVAPYRAQMEANLTAAVGAPVSVKATRAEGLGSLGRSEGVLCMAVALLVAE